MKRERITIRGIVQGVGFRPFVHRLALELQLSGWVHNDAGGVTLEAQGAAGALALLRSRLGQEAPPRARIDALEVLDIEPVASEGFHILHSATDGQGASIGPDTCTCPACLAEMLATTNRRYRYPFINCTDCGPRYTLAHGLPYDRSRTSMAGFALCPDCAAEYADAGNRRFHAEPNACPVCGPQLTLLDATGHVEGDPIAETLARLQRGDIVAIKGVGGFHLACDARNPEAVARLRERKQRDEQPFALMFANPASLDAFVELGDAERSALQDVARPIVLLKKRKGADEVLAGVAPGLAWLGAMLPYTPLHWLLFHEAAGRPLGLDWLDAPQDLALVMTSANPHGEPLVIDNGEALVRLASIADAFLLHNRDIVIRCDDSVVRALPAQDDSTGLQFLRRARGYTPAAIPLAQPGPQVLALGGHYKATLCFTRNVDSRSEAFLSQHIGDLDRVANCQALDAAVAHLQSLLQVKPQAIAHDLHPDFYSTRLAQRLANQWQVPAIAVQHHHAHIAAVLAEHGIDEPVLGLALDGIGMGYDGEAWGGELLRVDGARCERLGHLRPLALPGGDKAAREPWRMAAAALALIGHSDEIATRFADQAGATQIAQLLQADSSHALPRTTSLGRWFDAAAGLLGLSTHMSFEGQAAMLLEGLAETHGPARLHRRHHDIEETPAGMVLDFSPLLRELRRGYLPARAAARFHTGLVEGLAEWAERAAATSGLRTVACGGGCFLNALLSQGLREALARRGLRMLEAQAAPPGDGGLALGQAWVAQRILRAMQDAPRHPAAGALPQMAGVPDKLTPTPETAQETTPCV